jgi:hypothetical protein
MRRPCIANMPPPPCAWRAWRAGAAARLPGGGERLLCGGLDGDVVLCWVHHTAAGTYGTTTRTQPEMSYAVDSAAASSTAAQRGPCMPPCGPQQSAPAVRAVLCSPTGAPLAEALASPRRHCIRAPVSCSMSSRLPPSGPRTKLKSCSKEGGRRQVMRLQPRFAGADPSLTAACWGRLLQQRDVPPGHTTRLSCSLWARSR